MPSLAFFVSVCSKCHLPEKKKIARYEGTNPAATKGLVMGVPLSELEVDDTGVELNKGGLCVEEHDTSTVSSGSRDELEIDDSGITLVLDEHGVMSSDDTRGDGVVGTRTDNVSASSTFSHLLMP